MSAVRLMSLRARPVAGTSAADFFEVDDAVIAVPSFLKHDD